MEKQMPKSFSNNARLDTAVIPAGGLGTRLLPLTESTPKELVKVHNQAMIQYALNELVVAGITKLIVISSPRKKQLDEFFNINNYDMEPSHDLSSTPELLSRFDIRVTHQNVQLGLGDAVLYAEPYVESDFFLLLLPDEILIGDPNPSETLLENWNQKEACYVSVQKVPSSQIANYGVVGLEARNNISEQGPWKVNQFVEKPQSDNAPSDMTLTGRYVLSKDIFSTIRATEAGKNGEIQLTDALQNRLGESDDFFAIPFPGKRFDAGSHDGIAKLSSYLSHLDS
tara:strand:+ start:12810 stop:13661 length:852 start_codon:yes stop_codon:yes gene_type:complete